MEKRGQLAVFLVVSLLIFGVVLISQQMKQLTEKDVSWTFVPNDPRSAIKSYVESCLEEVGRDAIYFVALQGGYYSAPGQSTEIYGRNIPHYWDQRINLMPGKDGLEQQLSYYIGEHLPACLKGFRAFNSFEWGIMTESILMEPDDPSYGFSATKELLESFEAYESGLAPKKYPVFVTIGEHSVALQLKSPISIRVADDLFLIGEFHSEFESDIMRVHSLVSAFMDEQTLNPGVIPLAALSELAYENDFDYEIIHLDDRTVLFGFIFPHNPELIYTFINKYDRGGSP